jgi:basic amino acid/polyamine antiporter, APA family
MLNPTATTSSTQHGLIRILGIGFGLAVIVGSTIGIGILRTPGLVAGQLPNRSAVLAVWIVGGLYTLVGAACLAELGTMLPEAGGYYVYARRAFGNTVGFAVGWSDWITYCAVLGYVSIAMGEFTALIVPSLGGYEKAVSILALAALAGLQLCGLRVSSRFQELTTVVKCGAFLVVGIAAMLFAPDIAARSQLASQTASFTGLIVALQSVVITYGGWQSGLYFSEEDRDPNRNLPRSMIGGVAGVIVVYLLVNLALLSVLPLGDLARSTLPAADAAQVLLGERGREIITILSIVSLPPMLNAILMIGSRILFAMGRDGMLWRRAASVTAGGTPAAAMLATTLVALALIATGTFQRLVAVAAFYLAANYVVCCLALVVLRWREPDRARPYRAWGYPWSAALVLAGAAAFLVGAAVGDPINAGAALALVALGFLVRGGVGAASRRAAAMMLALTAAMCAAGGLFAQAPSAQQPPSSFARFVDAYLDRFAQYHPSIAAGNGIHGRDAQLEDFSSATIAAEIEWLRDARRTLDGFDLSGLTPDERVDHRILAGIVDGWLLDLETVRTWTRNPMIYAAAVSDGVHNLMTMESSPAPARMRQVISKLHGVPALLAAARTNIKGPPRVFVERATVMFHGASDLLARDLSLAFADVRDTALQKELASAADEARRAINAYTTELESSVLRSATGNFAIGTANVEARYRAEELIDLPASMLLAIGERELKKTQAAFAETAARIAPDRPPLDVWRDVLENHPKRGEVIAAAQKTVDELFAFIREHRLVDLPAGERVVVAPAPAYDLGLASMHSSPPLEPTPVKSYYYITDAQAGWSAERQNLWLQKFNYATLADISAHEVAPGHYVHSLFMRRTPGKIRRIWIGLNPFPQPSSGQDGWAHYAEQMISDEGFKRDDPRYRLAQSSEALTRICRLIAGLRLHSGEWSIDDAAQLFEREAHLPAPAARQEAVRGTYDPTYGGYFLGKLAAFTLRRDYEAARGASFSLREFHERVMTNGIAPWWAHRQLLLPGDRRAVIE